ncbi:MAG: F0F1 ATP synthase subunit epsilon [Bacteroidales bacterium]|mgnify:FL=1|nr:F0F1 ATP synthase subunit epsilon [Bacteroidales bacterium]
MRLVIITPEATLCDQEVERVFVPGKQGSFEILKGHAPLISLLVKGTVSYGMMAGALSQVEVGGGFVKVEKDTVTICVAR